MIAIGADQQVGQLVGKIMLADERVREQRPEHAFPSALDSSVQCQFLVRRYVGNEPGDIAGQQVIELCGTGPSRPIRAGTSTTA